MDDPTRDPLEQSVLAAFTEPEAPDGTVLMDAEHLIKRTGLPLDIIAERLWRLAQCGLVEEIRDGGIWRRVGAPVRA